MEISFLFIQTGELASQFGALVALVEDRGSVPSSLQLSVTPVPEGLTLSSASPGIVCMQYTDIHSGQTAIYKKKKVNKPLEQKSHAVVHMTRVSGPMAPATGQI